MPKLVSGRVVNTRMVSSLPSTARSNSAPSERPIQLRWITLIFSGQSRLSMPSRSSWAYCVMRKNHCSRSRFCTRSPERSQVPSASTCSLASTVWQPGHQLTGAFFR